MYQSFYGLSEMPFNITPDPKFLYLSPTHLEALQHLKYGVQEKKGFIVLVGRWAAARPRSAGDFSTSSIPIIGIPH
jgi:type II secretory pathway predicted ATPase ExeA